MKPLYQALALAVQAYGNCGATNKVEWREEHLARMRWREEHLARMRRLTARYMPSGSGFDGGTQIDEDASEPDKLVFTTSYHHMDDNGCYSGWTDHVITVTPSLAFGFTVEITGDPTPEFDGWTEYAHEVFHECLSREVDVHAGQ